MYRVPARPVQHRIDQDVLGTGQSARVFWLLRELAVELATIQRAYVAAMGLHEADLRASDLISQHWEHPLSMGELAELVGLSSGAVTGTIDRLAEAKFVERVADPADRRRVHLHLTRHAEEAGLEFYGEHLDALREVAAMFSDDELRVVERFLAAAIPGLAGDLDEADFHRALERVSPTEDQPLK